MKKMKSLVLLLLLGLLNTANAKTPPKEWCRRVKTQASIPIEKSKDSITIFAGEWFQVREEQKGDAKVGNKFILSDSEKCVLDYESRDDCTKHRPLTVHVCTNDNDIFIKVLKEKDTQWFYVIDQTNNVLLKKSSDFDTFISVPKPENCHEIRISPENRIASVFNEIHRTTSSEVVKKDTTRYDKKSYEVITHTTNFFYQDSIIVSSTITSQEKILIEKKMSNSIVIKLTILILCCLSAICTIIFIMRRNRKKTRVITTPEINVQNQKEKNKHTKHVKDSQNELHSKDKKEPKEILIGNDKKKQTSPINEKSDNSRKGLQSEDKNENKKQEGSVNMKSDDSQTKLESEDKNEDKKQEIEKLKETNKTLNKDIQQYKTDIKQLKEQITSLSENNSKEKTKQQEIQTQLNNSIIDIQKLNEKCTQLTESNKQFSEHLTIISFAEAYTKKINELTICSKAIFSEALGLLKLQLEDYYYIYKTISKYSESISTIDLGMLYTDINLILNGNMVLNSCTLSSFNPDDNESALEEKMHQYFFDKYLEKYVNATVVLNESLIGTFKMINTLPKEKEDCLLKYRKKLQDIISDLGLQIETVKLFDKIGNKLDLSATLVDAGFETGDILEIENCIVYFKGGRRPETKIKVKVQE